MSLVNTYDSQMQVSFPHRRRIKKSTTHWDPTVTLFEAVGRATFIYKVQFPSVCNVSTRVPQNLERNVNSKQNNKCRLSLGAEILSVAKAKIVA